MATRTTTSGCVAFFCEFLPTKAECVFFVLLDCLGGISKQWIPTAMFDWWVVVTIKFQPCQTSVFLIIFWMTNVETTPLRLGAIPMYSSNIGRGESSNNNFWLKLFGSSFGYIPISHKSLVNKFQLKSSIMKCWGVPPSWIIHCISIFSRPPPAGCGATLTLGLVRPLGNVAVDIL